MSDDWDAPSSAAAVAAPVVNQWADEDVSDDDAPDAWDAEPEVKEKGPELPVPEKKKAITKRALAKKEEEEKKLAEKLAKAALDDPNHGFAEKARLKKMEEDRDAALAGDLFGSDAIKVKDASSDLPQMKAAAAASSASASASAASAAPSGVVVPNALLKAGARLEESVLDTDADVDRFISDLGKRLEKLGKSAMASKKITKLIAGITEESIKLGVLRMDDVGELKRIMTVKHNDLTAKQKKGDKKGKVTAAAAKPVVTLARNAFMHGDTTASEDAYADDTDFM